MVSKDSDILKEKMADCILRNCRLMDLATVQFMDDLHWGVQQALVTETLSHATAPWNREWEKNCALKIRESVGRSLVALLFIRNMPKD